MKDTEMVMTKSPRVSGKADNAKVIQGQAVLTEDPLSWASSPCQGSVIKEYVS